MKEDTGQRLFICQQRGQIGGYLPAHPLDAIQMGHLLAQGLDDCLQSYWRRVKRSSPRIQSRKVQDGFDKAGKTLDFSLNQYQVLADALGDWITSGQQQFDASVDIGQWGAQLMRHHGYKIRF